MLHSLYLLVAQSGTIYEYIHIIANLCCSICSLWEFIVVVIVVVVVVVP
jgi:hypothetical protein